MKAEKMQRLFRAVAERDIESADKICESVIADERKKGHQELAGRLESIIKNSRKSINKNIHADSSAFGLKSLPSKIHNELYTIIPYESLRHHMVLPPEVEKRMHRIEVEYSRKALLATYGLKPRKKILLYGSPGNGKTLSAERLAWNTGLPLVKVRLDSIISSYLGETASNLRKLFDLFKEEPVVLFLDECDSIARSRMEGNDVGEIPRIANTLLQFLEEYDLPGILVAATNLEKALDTAFFRRFDDICLLPKPGAEEIRGLLKMAFSSFDISNKINWNKIVKMLEGKSAAFVEKSAHDAAKNAIFNNRRLVLEDDLELAISELHTGDHLV
ncbi:AAA family ATPase [Leptospira bouyouniensis]|uniref:ATP-binding protein n=1 Tax=Leptospira bouyouniensis TaxID=2484911 RepID=A0ABY2KZC6_9LEPT|nr:ATP-binding protein [Leptospira bouyouniensis]TGK45938.1 ATP-binding protein [Leptospira bouyouniensis]